MWKCLVAWIPMVFVAIANGLFREKFLANHFNELHSHQISTASFMMLFGIYVWILFKLWPPVSSNQAVLIGLIWLILTVIFEFLFGHYIAGHSWEKLLQDYNILQGRVWALVLIWIVIAPYIIHQIQN